MFHFAIDRGGTFTDVIVKLPSGELKVLKLLSVNPEYPDAPREAIRRVLNSPKGLPIDHSQIGSIRMGTTVATNALLERKGTPTGLVITKGFKDVVDIGTQDRPDIFDIKAARPKPLYDDVVEIEERVIPARDDCKIIKNESPEVTASTGEKYVVRKAISESDVREKLQSLLDKNIRSLAVVLCHGYAFHDHELLIERVATDLGFDHIAVSHKVMPMVKMVPRGQTTVVDAYLTPTINEYVRNFRSGFADSEKLNDKILFMRSDGGLTPVESFFGSRAVLSGPAGGVRGYAAATYERLEEKAPCIGFDMGGTSTDVSRWAGQAEIVYEGRAANVQLQVPQLDIQTVAAGGGSILTFRGGLLQVGPESASAFPGPACYRRGGPATVTDANLVLGRIQPDYFPKIFGPNEDQALDKEASLKVLQELANNVNKAEKTNKSVYEIAEGFIRVANEAMCRPIRNLTQARGFDCRTHVLSCFGGAGGQHACAIAKSLKIKTISLHKYAGILSAFGISTSPIVVEKQEPAGSKILNEENLKTVLSNLEKLAESCKEELKAKEFKDDQIVVERFLRLRYSGTDFPLMISESDLQGSSSSDWTVEFTQKYTKEFGFHLKNREIFIDDLRVRAEARTGAFSESRKRTGMLESIGKTELFIEGVQKKVEIFNLEDLPAGSEVVGPAMILCGTSTAIIEPFWTVKIDAFGDIFMHFSETEIDGEIIEEKVADPVLLSIFGHRFMSIAEQMGRVLQRTAISTNIKERLDFSCALFGPDGGLVSNAPHIPVHLGAMQQAVQYQLSAQKILVPGDVILSNHPEAGGSHLPDLTVITPVFIDEEKPSFFIANRGHHADIGGLTPGSMPPMSTSINEEGAIFRSFKIVSAGEFQESSLVAHLNEPAKHANCTGTRNLADNLADLHAQIAANVRGGQLVKELIEEYTFLRVIKYMNWIQAAAEDSVRDLLKNSVKRIGAEVFDAEDFMDDGTRISLKVTINPTSGDSIFDFTASDPEVYGNLNAPRAVTYSAVIYCLRCLIGYDVPLNQGCLNPVEIKLKKGTILSPSETSAVVGGNVLTSQRVVDVVLKSFRAAAASSGCMNNFCFGDGSVGYYETICGGAGAGPGWTGTSAVHTHMTNTRITDPEIMENRYAVILEEFSIRKGSGGAGEFKGGDGVVRKVRFRKPMDASLLTERRVNTPYGMKGGKDGSKGNNLIHKSAIGTLMRLPPRCQLTLETNDMIELQTPGGGGYGDVNVKRSAESQPRRRSKRLKN